jgi:hypothetical protein
MCGIVQYVPQTAHDVCEMVKAQQCYKNKVLWYLHTVLTYQSHVTPIVTHHRYL